MKVLYISEGNIPSKYAHTIQAMKMAEAISAHVRQLTLVTAGSLRSGRRLDIHRWYGVQPRFKIRRLPVFSRPVDLFRMGNHRRFTRAAALYARLKSPELVYTRSKQVARYCAQLGLRTVLETHSENISELMRRLRGAHLHSKLVGIVTSTEALREKFVAAGIPAEKIVVRPNGIDMSQFDKLPPKPQVRTYLGLPHDRTIVAYCGHFYPSKGVPQLIEAARLAPEMLFLLVGGWDKDIERMKRLSAGLDNVRYAGYVPHSEVPSYLTAADILVLPNASGYDHAQYTCPLKLFEYMAAGRPILATGIPAVRHLLRHNENSFLVEPDSPQAIAQGLRQLAGQVQLGQQLVASASAEIGRYSWDRRAQDIIAHFSQQPARQAA